MLTASVDRPTSTRARRAAVLSAASITSKHPQTVRGRGDQDGGRRLPVAKSSPTQVAILGGGRALLGLGAALAITRGAGRRTACAVRAPPMRLRPGVP